ncbi:MAG: diguanylate cyclase [Deltaproteobacteria bacterium]|jgi:diguanylate cyclase (GGDEF)-like protein|nr:diguanylate cyclase [Deltaproteobacteria bacterium]
MDDLTFNGFLITPDQSLQNRVLAFWSAPPVSWKIFTGASEIMQDILGDLPDILVCGMCNTEMNGARIAGILKSENIYSRIPVLLCVTPDDLDSTFSPGQSVVDDYFVLSGSDQDFKQRIELTIRRARRSQDSNPLTRLPGNTSIINCLQGCIDRREFFSMGYCDLDFFKSFNDKYGFARGDEILMMTARLIVNTLRLLSPDNYFVGHIGGDDFIFVLPANLAEEACQKIIASFDRIVPQFYDAEDRQKGGIISKDRQGALRSFPFMALSIAVVSNHGCKLTHVGEASHIAMALKKKAKETPTSCYVLDMRTSI